MGVAKAGGHRPAKSPATNPAPASMGAAPAGGGAGTGATGAAMSPEQRGAMIAQLTATLDKLGKKIAALQAKSGASAIGGAAGAPGAVMPGGAAPGGVAGATGAKGAKGARGAAPASAADAATQKKLTKVLKSKGSPLAAHVDTIMSAAKRNGIDPRLIVAISGTESGYAKNVFRPFNAWGMMTSQQFSNWDEGINAAAKLLGDDYVGQGLKSLAKIGAKWCPDGGTWVTMTTPFLKELGGNPSDVTAKAAGKTGARR